MNRDVAVVIVTFNSERHLGQCVEAARSWDRVGQVIVVDNASSDRSAALADKVAEVVVRMDSNVGFGTAQNRGVKEARHPYLLLLNPDARVHPDALEAGRTQLESAPDVAIVQGAILRSGDGREERWQGRPPGLGDLLARLFSLRARLGERQLQRLAKYAGLRYYADRSVREPQDTEFVAAVAPLVRRTAFETVGGFDEAFFLYAEDVDLCRRLRLAGWRLLALPVEWASHVGGASSEGKKPTQQRLWWHSHRRLVSQHWRAPRRWLGWAVTGVGMTLAARREARTS